MMPYKATQSQKSKQGYVKYSTILPNIIPQIHIAWLPVVFRPRLRTVLETLETQEFIEHDLYQ